jgi:hypothetical protein
MKPEFMRTRLHTLNYPYRDSPSLTNETCSTRVSIDSLDRGGRGGMGEGVGRLVLV